MSIIIYSKSSLRGSIRGSSFLTHLDKQRGQNLTSVKIFCAALIASSQLLNEPK